MKTNKCYKCGAHNRLKSKRCANCDADISTKGRFKNFIWIVIATIAFFLITSQFQKS